MKPEDVKKVGVIGCGLMGSGIVEVCARAEIEVTFVEASDEFVRGGRERIERSVAKAVDRGKLSPEDGQAALGRITGTTDFEALSDMEMVIEAVVENLEAKLDVFRTLDRVTRDDVILASNTSSIPIVKLGAATARPDKVIGMHFFNPPPVMKLIELVRALTTSDETVEFARAFAERLGKITVLSKDRAGFIVNLLLIPYLNGAVRMLEEGFATAEDIDAAVKLGLSHPMGPLELLDFVGLDTTLFIAEILYDEFKIPEYAPPPLLRRMVEAGRLGRKSGHGFFDYTREN
jgi:3-hydroxybutyryl-CoA dehydrogenase